MRRSISTICIALALLLSTQALAYPSGENVFRFKISGSGSESLGVLRAGDGSTWGHTGPMWRYTGISGLTDPGSGSPFNATFRFFNDTDGSTTTRSGTIARSTLGGLFRQRLGSAAGAEFSSRMEAAGYSTNGSDVLSPGGPVAKGQGRAVYSPTYSRTNISLADYLAGVASFLTAYRGSPATYTLDTPYYSSSRYGVMIDITSSGGGRYFWYPYNQSAPCEQYLCAGDSEPSTGAQPMTDEDLADWASGNLSPAEQEGLFRDPQSGKPLPLAESLPFLGDLNAP